MAVNGIEIAVGQKWRCRDAVVRTVESHDVDDESYPWGLSDRTWVTDEGRYWATSVSGDEPEDLIELVSEANAPEESEFVAPSETKELPEHGELNLVVGQVWRTRADGDVRIEWVIPTGEEYPIKASNGMWYAKTGRVHHTGDDPRDLMTLAFDPAAPEIEFIPPTEEYTGASVSYYKVAIDKPTSGGDPYVAECNDIIESLDLNYAEGNVLKALWRRAAARQGKLKKGYTDGRYDAEKVVFFANRVLAQEGEK